MSIEGNSPIPRTSRPEVMEICPELAMAMDFIKGEEILRQIYDLSMISDNSFPIGQGGQRLAYGKSEREARRWLRERMEMVGMEVSEHPGGLIGIYRGIDPDLPMVVTGSHFDTVADAGKFDGQFGLLASIEAVEALHEADIKPKRSIAVVAFDCEEPANMLGSRSIFLGLSEDELKAVVRDQKTARELLESCGYSPDEARIPVLTGKNVHKFIELHTEAGTYLRDNQALLGPVETITGKDIRTITFGDSMRKEDKESYHGFVKRIRITSRGIAGHGGTTRMSLRERADAMEPLTNFLNIFSSVYQKYLAFVMKDGIVLTDNRNMISVDIEKIQVVNGSANKIAGEVSLDLAIRAEDWRNVELITLQLVQILISVNLTYFYGATRNNNAFRNNLRLDWKELVEKSDDPDVVDLPLINPPEAAKRNIRYEAGRYYPFMSKFKRLIAASEFWRLIFHYGMKLYSIYDMTMTSGVIELATDNTIRMSLDVRGHCENVEQALNQILQKEFGMAKGAQKMQVGGVSIHISPPLPGSGLPVEMNREIAKELEGIADGLGFHHRRMKKIHAGEDAMHAQIAVGKAAFVNVRSPNGVAHSREETMDVMDIENSSKFLLATLYKWANE